MRDSVDRAAYSYLLGMYLGDGHIVHTRRSFRLEIACDPKYPGIIEEAMTALRRVLPANRALARVRQHTVMAGVYSNHLPCLFPQHGPGFKPRVRSCSRHGSERSPLDEHPEAFVRGLDPQRRLSEPQSDPGRERDWYEYPRYSFSNRSDDIRDLFTEAAIASECDRGV